MTHGAGGARVLIDPDSLRSAAARLRATVGELSSVQASLGGVGWPAMPPGLLIVVQNAVAEAQAAAQAQAGPLSGTVVELTRRAFWAQYADEMAPGYSLSDPRFTGSRLPLKAQQEFLNYLRDGTLLANATPAEAKQAGRELARLYANFRKDPRMVVELALALRAVERSGMPPATFAAFSASFINTFGPKNMDEIPRMLQAMECSQRIAGREGEVVLQDPKLLTDVADRWSQEGGKLPESALQLLAPYSMMLANASMSGKLTAVVEDEIASSSDTWATAALISQGGKFSEAFLLSAYRKGVVDQIAAESRARPLGAGNGESGFELTGADGKGLPADTKVIVLQALAGNKLASAAALSETFHPPVQVWDETKGNIVPVTSPIELLYRYGHFSDSGAAFGKAFVQGEGYEHERDPAVGATMTLRLIDQVVNHGRGDMTPVQVSLAGTVADHYIDSLHQSAYTGVVSLDYDPNRDGVPGGVHGGTLDLSQQQTRSLLSTLSADETSRHVLMKGVATYQTETIRKGFAGELPPHWPKELGAFDGSLVSANSANNVHDVEAAAARQAAITQALGTVLGIAHVPGADVVAQGVVGAASGTAGPTATEANEVFRRQIANQLSATITVGYLHAHPAALASVPSDIKRMETEHLAFQPTSFVDAAGHVLPWDKMTLLQQRTFELWSADHPGDGGAAVIPATSAMGGNIEDQTGN